MAITRGLPSRKEVREYLKDFPWENFKYEDEYFTDDDIDVSLKWAEERLGTLPPMDQMTVSEMPKYIMLNGTIAQLFKRAYIKATINYNPGIVENGINIPLGEEAQMFYGMYQNLDAEFSREATAFKKANNIKKALTGIESPYAKMKRGSMYYQNWTNG